MNDDDSMREQVSALVDGQLEGEARVRLVEQICCQEDLRGRWSAYHLVGEVLRSGRHSACSDSEAFVARLRAHLSAQPATHSAAAPAPAAVPRADFKAEAANEPVFRWKLVAGVASMAAAAAIGWNWIGAAGQAPAVVQLAQRAPAAATLASSYGPYGPGAPVNATRVLIGEREQPELMLRDPRLDALLEAHQQAGGASNMPSAFLRNATFEGPGR